MAKKFTKSEELTLATHLRSCAERALIAFYCESDYHSEAFYKEMDELLTVALDIKHKVN